MISIIVPHFNDVELLSKNLPKLIEAVKRSKQEWEILVADDASPQEIVEELSQLVAGFRDMQVRLLTSAVNSGFGPTVNRAVSKAKGEIVFVLKVDVLPKEPGYFSEMLKGFVNSKVFAVSSALESIERGKRELRGQGVVLFFRGLFQHFRTREDFRKWLLTNRTTRKLAFEFDARHGQVGKNSKGNSFSAWPDGGSSAYRREYFMKLGGFDPLFAPFYWEDTDLGYRAWKAGYQVLFASKAILSHDYREGSIHRYHNDRFLRILNLRNQRLFVWVNADLVTFLLAVLWTPYQMAVAIKNGDGDWFRAFLLAKLKIVSILRARFRRGEYFVKTDAELLKIFEGI